MAAEYFNSLGGFSVGIPEVPVIDANGNIITNVLTNGNVFANVVYATYYKFANGQPFNGVPAGSNTQLQYNNNGSFAGIPNVTFNGSNLSLGNVANIKIIGGLNGYFLQTDGAGNLTWAAGGGGGGNGSPGGANTQIQFNDAGVFGGDAGFTFNKITNTLDVVNVDVTGESNLGPVGNITITGGVAGYYLRTDGTGNLTWDLPGAGGNGTPGGSNTQVQFNDEGEFAGASTFTFDQSTGILTIPIVSANAISANGFQTTGNLSAGNIRVTGLANIPGTLRATGNINTSGSANINLGIVSNIHISGGVNGAVLTTDGLGNLSWQEGGGGGNGTPGGSNTQLQFNNNGLFGGSPFLTFNNSTNTVQVAGNLIANTFQMGAGVYQFSTSEVYFATTASMAPNQVLYSIPTDDISGVEFHIIATDSIGGTRQSSKISSVVYNGQVQFNEYAGLYINGGVGTLQVDYNAGNIISPPSVELKVSPDSSNQTVYKMLITVFAS
jgi:hypothetical protein